MNCADLDLLHASDDPVDRSAAEEHAAGCAHCASRLRYLEGLGARAAAWGATEAAPSPRLEGRVIEAVRAARPRPAGRPRVPGAALSSRQRGPRRVAGWAAPAAAAALVVAGVGLSLRGPAPLALSRDSGILAAEALEAAERAERTHAAAIARLAEAAEPLLARSGDPATPPREAALLLAYRERLRHLERTIDEIEGYLAQNRGNRAARTLLLAAYSEKTEVLRELLATREESEGGVS